MEKNERREEREEKEERGEKEEREDGGRLTVGLLHAKTSCRLPRPNPARDAGGIFCSNPAKNNVLGARLEGFSSAGDQKVLLGGLPGGWLELL